MIWLLATNNKQLYPLPEKKFPLALREASCIEISEGFFPPSPRVTWRWLVSDSGIKISSHLIQDEITDNTGNYCCSVAKLCSTLCDPMDCNTPGFPVFTISQSLLKFMSIELVIQSNHCILCNPLLLPSIFPSIRVFSNESALRIRWPEYWNFSILPMKYSELISFRIDWYNLLAVQGTLKSLFQQHNSKASILQCLAFIIQLS